MAQIVLFTDTSNPCAERPIGANVLSSYLNLQGYTTQVINFFLFATDEEFEAILDRCLTTDTILVGFSSTVLSKIDHTDDTQLKVNFLGMPEEKFLQRLQSIKQRMPSVKLILGGGSIIMDYLSDINQSIPLCHFDYIVIGQGEACVLAILESETKKTSLVKKDIVLSSTYKTTVLTDKIYPFDEFSTHPVAWSQSDHVGSAESIGIEIARGCIFKCSYCSYQLLGKKAGDYTKQKQLLIDEITKNYELFGITNYWATDEIINDSEDKVHFVVDVLQSLPFDIRISAYARLDLFWKWPWMIKSLADAGFVAWDFGIETINDRSGRAVGKGLGKKRTYDALCQVQENTQGKVFVTAQWIIGLPFDTVDSSHELFDFLNQKEIIQAISAHAFKPLYLHDSNVDAFSKYQYTLTRSPNKAFYDWTNQMGLTYRQANQLSEDFHAHFTDLDPISSKLNSFSLVPGWAAKAELYGISLLNLRNGHYSTEQKTKVLNMIQFEHFAQRQRFIDQVIGDSQRINRSKQTAMKKFVDWKSKSCDPWWEPQT